ncbi:MAG: DUF2267 domain-containing protein [Rubrobacter sp.]|nr:DUF2267 domain-containing protein [Rubrobacter sp.]
MQYQEFLQRVEKRITTEEPGAAELATAATLSTLGERLQGEEAENLAAQLPGEIKDQLTGGGAGEAGEFPLEEFYRRVGEKEDTTPEEAAPRARAVIGVLSEAVTGGEVGDVISSLPTEYEPLFR